jgi:hypothetical protein
MKVENLIKKIVQFCCISEFLALKYYNMQQKW